MNEGMQGRGWKPQLSVGVFSHNHEDFIAECLDSLDTRTPFQLVITDDGSQDETRRVIQKQLEQYPLNQMPVRAILDPSNRGFVTRLNDFLEVVSGEWFVLLSGDDRFTEGAIDRLLGVAETHTDVDVIFSRFGRIDSEGNEIAERGAEKRYRDLGRRFAPPGNPLRSLLSQGSFVAGGCTFVRNEFVRRHQIRFDSSLTNAEDYDFWMECASRGARFMYVDERCWDHRVLATSKYYSAGSERLRSELATIGRHRVGMPLALSLGGLIWGVQKWKSQFVSESRSNSVSIREAAELLQTTPPVIFLSLPVVALQGIYRRLKRWN
jgi:glycosyltransferase involved in cell wall biosynthesis